MAGNPNFYKGMPKPAHLSGGVSRVQMQDPGTRLKYLASKHGIASILKAMRDEKYLDKNFSTYDGMLVMGLASSLKGNETARENMLNRMFGKVADKQISLNMNSDLQPEQLAQRAQSLLSDLASSCDDESDLIA